MIAGLTLGSVLLGVALLVVVLLYLARPFAVPEDEEARLDREEVDSLVLRRDALLRQIRELDEDMEAAKVAPEMYQARRPQLVKQAALLTQQLDAHGYIDGSPAAAATTATDVDAEMEAAVRQLRTPQEVDDDIEAAVRQARQRAPNGAANAPKGAATAAVATTASYCPKCGRRVDASDRFCPKCGHNLTPESTKARPARA